MDKITEQMLRMSQLANNPVDVKTLEPVEDSVELTEQEWKDLAMNHKIVLEGKEHVVAFQNRFVLKPVTIKTDDKGNAKTNKVSDYEKDGGDAEKVNKKMVDNDKDGGTKMVKEEQATKDHDEDGKIESKEEEYKGSRDKAIEKEKAEEKKEEVKESKTLEEERRVGPVTDEQREAGKIVHDHLSHGKKKYGYGDDNKGATMTPKEKEEAEYQAMLQRKKEEGRNNSEEKKDPDSFIKSSALKNASISEKYENKQEFDDTDADEYYGLDTQRGERVKIPKKLTTSINSKIKEIAASIDHYDEKGYNDGDGDNSNKIKAMDALEQIKSNLSLRTEEGMKQAQLFFLTLMSPITDLFPADVVNFLAKGDLEDGKDGGEFDKVEPFETSLKEAFGGRRSYMFSNQRSFDRYFNQEVLPNSGIEDAAAYREAYNNLLDSLIKDGSLPPNAENWIPQQDRMQFPMRESTKVRSISEILEERKKAKKDPCWKGYTQVGMKKKNGKEVPNCVKNEEK
jgi:hypothetical protein